MQRLAPSLMPATRYVSKQLADFGRYSIEAGPPIGGIPETFAIMRGEPPGIGVRAIEQGYPIRTAHQEIPF